MRLNSREFDATMRRYLEFSKRDWATSFNTKGFFIARRATVETPKASASEIRKLRERPIAGTATRRGKTRTVRYPLAASRAAMIVQAIRKRRGESALSDKELPEAVKKFLAYRVRSVAFIKSGWLPAIRKLGAAADVKGGPRQDRSAKQLGRPKGDAIAARLGWRCRTVIINSASTNRDHKAALIQYGEPALQRAFGAETASMRDYIARKLTDRAKRLGIRTR